MSRLSGGTLHRWSQFASERPKIIDKGRSLMYEYGPGLAYLATADTDGGPRLHPIVVSQIGDGLYAFIVPGPKASDLRRNPKYALHTYRPEEVDDEFALRGEVRFAEDGDERAALADSVLFDPQPDWPLVEFLISSAMTATYKHRGDRPPTYDNWSTGRCASSPIRPTALDWHIRDRTERV